VPEAPAPDADALAAVLSGEARAGARLISRIESRDPGAIPLLRALYARGGGSAVVGITGPPGAGKSTLVDQLVACCRRCDLRVAVLAVDPSSPWSGGAILGDRVRMNRHNTDAGVFIRSMSARGRLGGLAAAAGDALTVLDAMGFDWIFIETVGVGQSEIDIASYADAVVIVQTPAGGDGVQALKSGVLEIGDLFLVNKADLPGADRAVSMLRDTLEHRSVRVLKLQAADGIGIDEVFAAIRSHLDHLRSHPAELAARRRAQLRARLLDLLAEQLRVRYGGADAGEVRVERLLDEVIDRRTDPHAAVAQLLAR
jgi:LAO/AO transport system kinase